jgi:Ni/Fe-hydrogenase subunit HybB-like protein
MKRIIGKITLWRAVAGLIILAGLYSTYVRFTQGLGASTHLNDQFPWGLWIGFDILCGVGLAAGGFTLAAMVYIFNIKRFEPIIRPTILTAFLGYMLVIFALMFDLGRPLQIWHAIIMWNHHSVMFEVAWCVMLYTTVLALEFSPVVLEKFKMYKTQRSLHKISIPLIILGVLLSTLHQSSLGSLYLIIPEKLYPLWYSAYLPVFFYVSAIGVGCAMVIFESFLSARAFGKKIELDLLSELSRVSVVVLSVLAVMKFVDLKDRDVLGLLLVPRPETYFYWAEIAIGIIAPIALFSFRKVRQNTNGLFAGATCIILGFIINRLDISLTGMENWAGMSYFPSWMEISITVMIVTIGFIVFRLAAQYLPVFHHSTPAHSGSNGSGQIDEDLHYISRENKDAVLVE